MLVNKFVRLGSYVQRSPIKLYSVTFNRNFQKKRTKNTSYRVASLNSPTGDGVIILSNVSFDPSKCARIAVCGSLSKVFSQSCSFNLPDPVPATFAAIAAFARGNSAWGKSRDVNYRADRRK